MSPRSSRSTTASVLAAVKGCSHIFTVEEHSIIGGLGSAVAEVLAEHPGAPVYRIGVRDHFGESGVADELLEKYGLQPPGCMPVSSLRCASAESCTRFIAPKV